MSDGIIDWSTAPAGALALCFEEAVAMGDPRVVDIGHALAVLAVKLRAERDEARALVRDATKYVTEDRATTPGFTRLARWGADAADAVKRWGPP